ncbi:hypothetical protein [Haladaptatus sp. DFWS20]|uniref:hypothetical protein n=1 Tax=Haladaptatus sp. DFWS20 TaxID=3403467 RepID=UPI003EB8017D
MNSRSSIAIDNGKFEAKASAFRAGMKPTNSIQPPTMARPVRFEWDAHEWAGKPHPHESPKEVRTNPQVVSVGR